MIDKLLTKQDIAAMLGTTPGVAASILAKQGVMPIDFGMGRGRGTRWLESAVVQSIQTMHNQAQNQTKKATDFTLNQAKKCIRARPAIHLHQLRAADIYALTHNATLQ